MEDDPCSYSVTQSLFFCSKHFAVLRVGEKGKKKLPELSLRCTDSDQNWRSSAADRPDF